MSREDREKTGSKERGERRGEKRREEKRGEEREREGKRAERERRERGEERERKKGGPVLVVTAGAGVGYKALNNAKWRGRALTIDYAQPHYSTL